MGPFCIWTFLSVFTFDTVFIVCNFRMYEINFLLGSMVVLNVKFGTMGIKGQNRLWFFILLSTGHLFDYVSIRLLR